MSRVALAEALVEGYTQPEHDPRGLTLREVRHRSGHSIRDVEDRTGIHRGVLSTIERGLRIPTLHELRALSHLYEVPLDHWHVVVEYRIREEVTTS